MHLVCNETDFSAWILKGDLFSYPKVKQQCFAILKVMYKEIEGSAVENFSKFDLFFNLNMYSAGLPALQSEVLFIHRIGATVPAKREAIPHLWMGLNPEQDSTLGWENSCLQAYSFLVRCVYDVESVLLDLVQNHQLFSHCTTQHGVWGSLLFWSL